MSKKTREAREDLDLFSLAGLLEQSHAGISNSECAAPTVKPNFEPQKNTDCPAIGEDAPMERYLRDLTVANRYDVSRQTVWRWAAQGTLPMPIKLSEGVTRWRESELLAHEASLPKGATAKAVGLGRLKPAKAGDQR